MEHEAVGLIKGFSKPSAVLSDSDRKKVGMACEAAKQVMRECVMGFVREMEGVPLMTSKSCDGTPLRLVKRESTTLPSGKRVNSQGKEGSEVNNQFVRGLSASGKWVTKVMLSEGTQLQFGKGECTSDHVGIHEGMVDTEVDGPLGDRH